MNLKKHNPISTLEHLRKVICVTIVSLYIYIHTRSSSKKHNVPVYSFKTAFLSNWESMHWISIGCFAHIQNKKIDCMRIRNIFCNFVNKVQESILYILNDTQWCMYNDSMICLSLHGIISFSFFCEKCFDVCYWDVV